VTHGERAQEPTEFSQNVILAILCALGVALHIFDGFPAIFRILGLEIAPEFGILIGYYLVACLGALFFRMWREAILVVFLSGAYAAIARPSVTAFLFYLAGVLVVSLFFIATSKEVTIEPRGLGSRGYRILARASVLTAAIATLMFAAFSPELFPFFEPSRIAWMFGVSFAALGVASLVAFAMGSRSIAPRGELWMRTVYDWHSLGVSALIIVMLIVTGFRFFNQTVASTRALLARDAFEVIGSHASWFGMEIEDELGEMQNRMLELSDLMSVQNRLLDLAFSRVQFTYLYYTRSGAEGLYWVDERLNPVVALSASGKQEVPGDIIALLTKIAHEFPARETSFASIHAATRVVVSGKPHVAVVVPVYWFRESARNPTKRPDGKRVGFLVLVVDPLMLLNHVSERALARGEYYWSYMTGIGSEPVLIDSGPAGRSLGSIAAHELAARAKSVARNRSARGTYSFYRFESETMSFVRGQRETHIYAVESVPVGVAALNVVVASPERAYLEPVSTFSRDVGSYVIVAGLLVLLVGGLSLANALDAGKRLGLLVREKEDEIRSLYEKEMDELKALVEHFPYGVLLVDENGAIRLSNAMADVILAAPAGIEVRSVRGTPIEERMREALEESRVSRGEALWGKRVLGITASPVRVGNETLCAVGLSDITEVRKLQEAQMLRSRIRSIGDLAAGVAHEIGNPLAIALGFAELLERDENLTPEQREYVTRIIDSLKRSADVTKNMLIFGRDKQEVERQLTDLNELAAYVLDVVEPVFAEHGVELVSELSAEKAEAMVDPGSFEQVLMNILQNAREAIERAGIEDGRVVVRSQLTDGSVTFEVEDNGPGIPRDVIGRVFDPFFTTKENEPGFGIGLSVAYRLAEQDGGKIEVESESGRGTTFRITYPRVG
jgi:signal transduction histidine kinase